MSRHKWLRRKFQQHKDRRYSIPYKILGSCQPAIAIALLQLNVILQFNFPCTFFLNLRETLGVPMPEGALSC